MQLKLKTPHYRIEDPVNQLAVRFHCEPAPAGDAPKITTELTAPERASVFAHYRDAAYCFAKFLRGQPLDIVRVDL